MQPDWFIVVCWRLLNNFGDTPTASVYLNFVCVYIIYCMITSVLSINFHVQCECDILVTFWSLYFLLALSA